MRKEEEEEELVWLSFPLANSYIIHVLRISADELCCLRLRRSARSIRRDSEFRRRVSVWELGRARDLVTYANEAAADLTAQRRTFLKVLFFSYRSIYVRYFHLLGSNGNPVGKSTAHCMLYNRQSAAGQAICNRGKREKSLAPHPTLPGWLSQTEPACCITGEERTKKKKTAVCADCVGHLSRSHTFRRGVNTSRNIDGGNRTKNTQTAVLICVYIATGQHMDPLETLFA